MILVETDRQAGKVIFDRIDPEEVLHLNLNKEFDSVTHSFYFKVIVDEILGNGLTFSIDNAGKSPYSKGWDNYAPFESSDGKIWNRTREGKLVGSTFSFDVEGYGKELLLSWYIPYSLDRYYHWITELAASNSFSIVRHETLADYMYAGAKSKPAIVIVARQHPGESMTSFVMEGLVESFRNNLREVNDLLEKHSVIIFPLFNKSGVKKGFHRVNENGVDLNRSWDSTALLEITHLKNQLAGFSNIHSIIDIHGDEVSRFNYVYYKEGLKNEFQQKFLNCLNSSSPKIVSIPSQSFFKRFIKHLIRNKKILMETGLTLTQFGRKEYEANSFTIEVSAKISSETDCRDIGHNIFSSIIHSI